MGSLDHHFVLAHGSPANEFASPSVSQPLGGRLKRCIDVTIGVVALLALWPLFFIIMAALRLTESGPLFFGHQRIGFRGQGFACIKFRTMVPDAEQILKEYLQNHPELEEEWALTHKLRNDPRVTSLGRFLRETSLDELPQLWNVIRGDMSIVGPRPIVLAEVLRYTDSFFYYAAARPGITGLWQVMGRSNCSYEERVRYDVSYVRDWSLARDMSIFLKTIIVVLSRRGSF